ncbi:hypothetical protein [Siccirubricoccus deserti]|uniref:Uncharacterized protein n=1 Tax=Siccirubricoccus deserti TaxID=2013562 RepID=A0A9X0UCY4_9PROT|nr:hypothetical protein [Siccirubricoccus deserti]MBC4014953.1 hypothetical protein [Siccirubricoccus deserti]
MAAPVFGLEAAAAERLLLAAMPPGWRVLGRCRYGTAGPAVHATGCHALAHPAFGIALIDVAPDATPNAESRLRRALNAVRFWEEFPGNLPVWHGRVEGGALRELDGLVRDAFADMSPLTVPGKSAWVAAAAAALAEDAAWQVPGRPLRPALAPLMIEHETAAPRHAWRSPRLAATAGFALTFILGLGAGALLLGDESPAPVRTSEAATQAGPEVAAVPATRTPPAEATAGPPSDGRPFATTQPELPQAAQPILAALAVPPQVAQSLVTTPIDPPPAVQPTIATPAAPPPEVPPIAVAPAPKPMPAEAPPPPRVLAAETAPEPSPAPAGPAIPVLESAPPPDEPTLEAALPTPPPPPPRPTPRPVRRQEAIDRACRDAVFRFQQGGTLSATERMHIRNGCATRR